MRNFIIKTKKIYNDIQTTKRSPPSNTNNLQIQKLTYKLPQIPPTF